MPLTIEDFLAYTKDAEILPIIVRLDASAAPLEVAATYDTLLRDAYWKHKRIDLVSAIYLWGMAFCLRKARKASEDQSRIGLLSSAKTLAYNLASFTWPGWDEPGITLTPELLTQGLAAARINLNLADDLQKPADKIRNAHWVLGAQLLAAPHAGHLEDALTQFELALPPGPAPAPPQDEFHILYHGYVLLAHALLKKPGADAAWSGFIELLGARIDDAGKFTREQLLTAHRIFMR